MHFSAFVLMLLAVSATAADPVLPRTLMCERGEVLVEETFDDGGWGSRWGRGAGGWQAGEWTAVDGGVQGKPIAAENHHPALPKRVAMTDVVLQFRFRFDDCDSIFLGFDDKEHIARLFLRGDSLELTKTTGIGGTTRSERIDRGPATFKPGAWHTAVIELCGTEFCAHVDERWIAYGSMEGIDLAKSRFELMCHGKGGVASFDDVRVWKATLKADWDKRRPQVVAALKKRKP